MSSTPKIAEESLACFRIAGYPVCLAANRIRSIDEATQCTAINREAAQRIAQLFSNTPDPEAPPRLLRVEDAPALSLPVHGVEFHLLADVELLPWPPFLAGLSERTGCAGIVKLGPTLRYLLDMDRLATLCQTGEPA